MVTDKDYNYLADKAYAGDVAREEKEGRLPVKNGQIFEDKDLSQDYKVLKVEDNTENGMQAMAVAPIKNGKVDTSEVVIAFAGTNFGDSKDRATDIQTVAGGDKQLALDPYNKTDGQAITAQNFADDIKAKYPNAIITTTGHSLGEYLALMIAAENQWRNVGFNGPDPYGILSPKAKEWIKNNPGMLTNYRNRGDSAIGNLMGNGTGAQIKVSLELGLDNPLTYHSLSVWKFDNKGNLIIPKNGYNKKAIQEQAERQLKNQFILSMYTLELLKKKFKSSSGGLSTNEQIYLNNSQALAVVQYTSSEFEVVMTNTVKIYQDGTTELEELWQKMYSKAFSDVPDLSHGEVMEVLESTGSSEHSIVTEPSELFREKIAKAKKMNEQFNQLTSEIRGKIAELVQRDQELARQLG